MNITAKKIMEKSKEFEEGAKAFGEGVKAEDCPYIANSMSKKVRIARREWRSGWHDAYCTSNGW